MTFLVDTNVLLRSAQPSHPMYADAVNATNILLGRDTSAIYPEWERLVMAYGVVGVNVHDARLVAAMLVYQVTHILTFNTRDFARYSEITAIAPIDITPEQTQA
ncbi:hypothetical protein [Chroococcidiopsis sp. CCMEE 29]|uniref:type II toxin-antitoxin system VapC family toxin n=1 Tax=Chroococcidiopsis sp. CCMEE 29 TaxID=155894 RepID=UPI002020CAAE|nr:hypothetical protein [Chroococcidiopsis sp. CCMEE 29]